MADEADKAGGSPSEDEAPQGAEASSNATPEESDRDNETPDKVTGAMIDADVDSANQNPPEVSGDLAGNDSSSEKEFEPTASELADESTFETNDAENEAFDFVNENVSSIRKSVVETHEQLATARKLIYICASIAGVVMVASIVFYAVMTGQLAQKTTELDRVLMAVAKRGMQLGNGIEKLSEIETDLLALDSRNGQIVNQLNNLEASVQEIRNSLQSTGENASINHSELKSTVNQAVMNQIEVQKENFLSVSNKLKSFESLTALPAKNRALAVSIDRLGARIESMGTQLDDLYMLEKSQIKDIMRSLRSEPNAELEPDAEALGD